MEGKGERFPGRAAKARGDALAEFTRRLPAEGEDQDAARVDAAPLDPLRNRGDDRSGLAGARARQHEQRAALMVDDLLLRLIEARLGRTGQVAGGWRVTDEPVTVHYLYSSTTL